MNYRVMMAAVMVAALLAASAATAEEVPEIPVPNDAVTAVDGYVDTVVEIDDAAEPAAQVAVDRVVTAAETAEMTGQATEPMGPPIAVQSGLGASSDVATGSPPASVGHVEGAEAENAVRIQGMGAPAQVADIPVYKPRTVAEVDHRASPAEDVPVAVAAPTYEHRAPETPAPDIAALEPQDKLTSNAERAMSEVAQRANADIPHC